ASCTMVPGGPAAAAGDRLRSGEVVPLPSSPNWLVPKPYSTGTGAAARAGAAGKTLTRPSTLAMTRTTLTPLDLITHPPGGAPNVGELTAAQPQILVVEVIAVLLIFRSQFAVIAPREPVASLVGRRGILPVEVGRTPVSIDLAEHVAADALPGE